MRRRRFIGRLSCILAITEAVYQALHVHQQTQPVYIGMIMGRLDALGPAHHCEQRAASALEQASRRICTMLLLLLMAETVHPSLAHCGLGEAQKIAGSLRGSCSAATVQI